MLFVSKKVGETMKIGIIGFGTVGQAIYHGFKKINHDVQSYDIVDNEASITSVLNTDIVFVCVPTNSDKDGRCDTSIVDKVINELAFIKYPGVIAIKSTVIPGTSDRLIAEYPDLKICTVPEFLRQDYAKDDFFNNHDVLVVGTNDFNISKTVIDAHGAIPKTVCVVSPTEAEITKYFNNVHNAVEVVFANAMNEMCEKLGADYQKVFGAISNRSNINVGHLKCNAQYRGFGGACLPKDTLAWKQLAQSIGVDVKIFSSICDDNRRYQ